MLANFCVVSSFLDRSFAMGRSAVQGVLSKRLVSEVNSYSKKTNLDLLKALWWRMNFKLANDRSICHNF
jgi:hypothetical protein